MELNTIYNEDCFDTFKRIPDKSIDLLVTDMPYEDTTFKWLPICFEKLKDTGSSYVITNYRSAAELKLALDKLGIFRNWIVWCYRVSRPCNSQKHFIPSLAHILFYTKTDNYYFKLPRVPNSEITRIRWQRYADDKGWVREDKLTPSLKAKGGRFCIGIDAPCPTWWYFPVVVRRGKEVLYAKHPYQKPVALMERAIIASSQKGDIVLDPFMGSGTTAVACINLNRNYIGSEINKEYYDIAIKRLERSQIKLLV